MEETLEGISPSRQLLRCAGATHVLRCAANLHPPDASACRKPPACQGSFSACDWLSQRTQSRRCASPPPLLPQGACATVVADAFFTPLDTVKQRLQIANSPYRSLSDCFMRTLREEGWAAFYRSCAWAVRHDSH